MKKEIRCGCCNRLLAKGVVVEVEIKCPRCKTVNHVSTVKESASIESHRTSEGCFK